MLAPDKVLVKGFLEDLLISYQSVTLAAISLQQSQFFEETNPPQWQTTLATQLNIAQSVATDWLVTNGPNVIANIPAYFIQYATSMQVVSRSINAPNTTQQQALQSLNWLKKNIQAIPTQEAALYKTLADFTTKFEAPKNEIETALTDANNEVQTDRAQTLDLENQISDLYQDISSETANASNGMKGVITSGASLSFGLLSFGYAVAVGSTVGPVGVVVGVIVGLGGLTIGAITNAINEQKIADNLGKIKDLQVSLLQENQAIAIVQNIQTMLHNLDDAITNIKPALDSSSLWSDESDKLDDAITALQNYTGSNFQSLPDISSFGAAAATWNDIATMALNLQKAVTGMPSTVITIPS